MSHKKDDAETFGALVENAFDFLERSISEFAESPKFSVIHFCAALEMFLKARLMAEHWTLIVAKPELAKREDFLKGAFVSVTLEQARDRLNNVIGVAISKTAYESFKELSVHRNKLIHFFHSDLANNQKAKEKIVSEQAKAWFYLQGLLHDWKPHFANYQAQIDNAEHSMRQHGMYLVARYDEFKPELDRLAHSGIKITGCNVCSFPAAVPKEVRNRLFNLECKVCDHHELAIGVPCPHCRVETMLSSERTCSQCAKAISSSAIIAAFTDSADAYRAMMDGDDVSTRLANCGECDGYHTVLRCEDKFLCVECFTLSDSVSVCDWCGDENTSQLEESFLNGCGHCGGFAGDHDAD